MRQLKEWIKRHPRVYDSLNALRPGSSPTEKWLREFAAQRAGPLTFIQVGANDGLRWDPFRRFILRGRWSGVLVEPLPGVFEILKRNYASVPRGRLQFLNAAVSSGDVGAVDLYTFGEEFLKDLSLDEQLNWLQKSSLSREQLLRHVKTNARAAGAVERVTIPCMTLQAIIEGFLDGEVPDLIISDAEGHDDQVIYGLDLDSTTPDAIVFEAHSLGDRADALRSHLESHGYQVHALGGDSVAVFGSTQPS